MTILFGLTGPTPSPEQLKRVAASLVHGNQWRGVVLSAADGLTLGGVRPEREPAALSIQRDANLQVAVAGELTHDGVRLDAVRAADRYRRDGLTALTGGEGSHVVAIHDEIAGELTLFADPLGTTPLCYGTDGGRLAFGPEAKSVLALLNQPAILSRDNTLQFLMNRYLIGSKTLFAGVHRLGPGELLRFNTATGKITIQRYWDLAFQATIHSANEAADSLYHVLLDSHQTLFDELTPNDEYQMFLTGGMDSRGILAFAGQLGVPPARALTWGAHDGLEGSDPVIARRIAEDLGVPFEFCPVDGEAWVNHARRWAWIGELLSDNANSYATSADYFSRWGSDRARFLVLGDQMFGAGPLPGSIAEAVDNVLHTALRSPSSILSRLLKTDSHQHLLAGFDTEVRELIAGGPNSEPKDIQDYLFFHTYIARWILAPGNFKLPVLPVQRPLMTLPVIDKVRQFAPLRRVDKTVYVDMLKTRFSHLLRHPVTSSDAGVNWARLTRTGLALRPALQTLTTPERLAALPIAEDLDLDRTSAFLRSFFAESANWEQQRGRWRRTLYDLRRMVSRSHALGRMASRIQPLVMRLTGLKRAEQGTHPHQLVMRLALLSILQEGIDEGWFDLEQERYPVAAESAGKVDVIVAGFAETK